MRNIKFLKILIFAFNALVIIRVLFLCVFDKEKYIEMYNDVNIKYVYSSSAPRGRILDRNGNILVDNKGIKVLKYSKISGVKNAGEIEIAKKLSEVIEINYDVDEKIIKDYCFMIYKDDILSIVDDKVKDDYKNRKISYEEYISYVYDKISDDFINRINKEEAIIYYLMNKGYSYQDKVIYNNLSDEEFAKITELDLDGVRVDMNYIRIYNYDTILNELFGDIGYIQESKMNYYIDKGYSLDDVVGISFLEEYYEDYLRGEKAKYKVNKDNSLELISEMKRGDDLVLNIDIDIQLEIEEIIKKEILNAKKNASSKYYKGSYVVISDPFDGGIISLVGINYDGKYFNSDVVGTFLNSYTVGSVVKGASHAVLYKNNIIDENTIVNDSCVKLANQNEKCSWKKLGSLNDINALAYSSNYFQFVNAIKLSGSKYKRNMIFNADKQTFDSYRNIYAEFGLGVSTGVDIFNETTGIRGSTYTGDLLLNLSIGQYDTYTALQLNQYISTIANGGNRYSLRLLSHTINRDGNINYNNVANVINKVSVDSKYIKRIQMGLNSVCKYGTGAGYFKGIDGSGKTGTSETFYNGKSTTTKSFVGYFPADDPMYAISIISPNIGYENSISNYVYPINSRISRQIANILFEN